MLIRVNSFNVFVFDESLFLNEFTLKKLSFLKINQIKIK